MRTDVHDLPRSGPRNLRRILTLSAVWLGLVSAVLPPAAVADLLVTRDGETVETQGPWKVKGRMVVFTDAAGTLSSLRLDDLDLDASHAATQRAAESAAGKPAQRDAAEAEPAKRKQAVLSLTNRDVARAAEDRPAAEIELPQVIMYSTSWCGYCRKARRLLAELGVDYVEKDIEKSSEARREHQAKAGAGTGVPVFDFDGKIVRGFDAEAIAKVAADLQRRRGEAAAEESGEGGEPVEDEIG